jgi:hypothetical protein
VQTVRFNGKYDLLDRLPTVLSGYARARHRGEDVRVAVLVDQDLDDCLVLKEQLEKIASDAGLLPRRASGGDTFAVVNRIAVREVENWYFGDWEATRKAFPKLPVRPPAAYRGNADCTAHKTSERFRQVLTAAGVAEASKKVWAERVAPHLDPDRNQSPSFTAFVSGLLDMVGR